MKSAKILNGNRNQCGGCFEYFNSNTAFDMHRTGEYGHNRRCLNAEEMKSKGMFINKDGFWISEQMKKIWRNDDSQKINQESE